MKMTYVYLCLYNILVQQFQATVIMLNILSALVVGIVEYLSPWPILLMAILLLIPIFPTLCSNQHEGKVK